MKNGNENGIKIIVNVTNQLIHSWHRAHRWVMKRIIINVTN